jgi:hypothetical protein
MGFLSGLGQLAANAVAPTLNVAAAREAANRQATEQQQQMAIQALILARQQQQAQVENALKQAQAGQAQATTAYRGAQQNALEHPKPNIQRGPGGQLGVIDPNDPTKFTPIGPAPAVKPTGPTPGTPEYMKLQTDLARMRASFAPSPNVYLTGQNAQGQPEIYAGASRGTPSLTPMGVAKPVGGAGGSASLSPVDREKMLNQAKIDNETMKAYENKVMTTGQAPGTLAGLAGAAASGGGTGFQSQAIGILGNKATGAIDSDYQRYITAQRSYGRIMGNLQSKRYTDHQAEIERSISGLQGNDLNSTIKYKQQLRDASLAEPAATPAPAGAAGKYSPNNPFAPKNP